MNCDCVRKTEERMLATFNEQNRFNKKVIKVEIDKALIFGEQLETVTYCEVEIELEGQKKKLKQNLIHNYCPICGVKIKKDTETYTIIKQLEEEKK